MSMHNATENAALKVFLNGIDPPYRAAPTQYMGLFTADPGETGSLASEANYTGYARTPLTKASAWTDSGSDFSNTGLVQFGPCTAGASTVTHFAVVDTGSGPVNMMISGELSGPLAVSAGIQPQFPPETLVITAD